MTLSDRAIEAVSLLTNVSVGDILGMISDKKDLSEIINLALENFYEHNRVSFLGQGAEVEALNSLEILKQCLLESKKTLQVTDNPHVIAQCKADIRDLRKQIKLLNQENHEQ